jgi:hypothetical protein
MLLKVLIYTGFSFIQQSVSTGAGNAFFNSAIV